MESKKEGKKNFLTSLVEGTEKRGVGQILEGSEYLVTGEKSPS